MTPVQLGIPLGGKKVAGDTRLWNVCNPDIPVGKWVEAIRRDYKDSNLLPVGPALTLFEDVR